MPEFETQQKLPTLTIGGSPWVGCPGSLARRMLVSQLRRFAWHTEGRLGSEVSKANPKLLDALESYVSGQMAARAAQHKADLERISNGN